MPAAQKPAPAPVAAPDPATQPAAAAPMDKAALKAHHAIVRRQTTPWWTALLPDMRGWCAMGFFALAAYLIYMIGQDAKLLDSAPFMQFAGSLLTGGVLLVGSYLFGGTKSGADTNAKVADTLKGSGPPSA